MILKILGDYTFLSVAVGAVILAVASGMVGCVTVQKGQSLLGDAVGHATFPGIVALFMLTLSRDVGWLMLGALLAGVVTYFLITFSGAFSKTKADAALAIFLSGMFGLGMVLKSHIQGNKDYQNASQSGLQNYIFGQAAYMMKEDVIYIAVVSTVVVALLLIFYKEIKLFTFDEVYARTIGLNTGLMNILLMVMAISLITVGLKAVGAILISSFLIIPAITALQWSARFSVVLVLAAAVGAVSAFVGTWLSTVHKGMSTGPAIILIMGCLAFISLAIAPRGIIRQLIRRRRGKGGSYGTSH